MRTLEAWGAMIENDHRAYYTAGGRVWVLDLEPAAGKKKRLDRGPERRLGIRSRPEVVLRPEQP